MAAPRSLTTRRYSEVRYGREISKNESAVVRHDATYTG